MILRNITSRNSWCPYCVNKKLCENCDTCYNKSFSSHPKSIYWSEKNDMKPIEVFKTSHKKYIFNCECGHEFISSPKTITYNKSWCPYCSNPSKKLCKNIHNCSQCYNKTFASIERSCCWSSKNKKKPQDVFKSTSEKFIFNCDKCSNEFNSKLCHVTDGSWCPNCRYKTEEKLTKILKNIYPLIQKQAKYDWCKDKKYLPFDFVLEEQKIIVECDGIQHWKQVAKWKTPEHNRQRDVYKMKCANENGYSIIRIIQEDIFIDNYDWLTELLDNINKIVIEKIVQNIYMCKNDEYKDFNK